MGRELHRRKRKVFQEPPWAAKVLPPVETLGSHHSRHEARLQPRKKKARGFGSNLILDNDVRSETLAILLGQVLFEGNCEAMMERGQLSRLQDVSYTSAKRTKTGNLHLELRGLSGSVAQGSALIVGLGQRVKQREVGCDPIELRRVVLPPLTLKPGLRRSIHSHSEDRSGCPGFHSCRW